MVQPSGRRGNADLDPITDRTCRVEGRPITASSRSVRGRHSTSNLPVTPTPLTPGFHHGTGEAGYSIQPPAVPFRSRPPLQLHLSHTPVSYELYGSTHPPSHPTDTVYDPYLHAPTIVRPHIPYRSAIQEPILEFRGQPRQIGVEFFYQMLGAALRILHAAHQNILMLSMGEADERGDDDGDGGDDDQDDGDDDGDEKQTVYVAHVAPASRSDRRPRHENG
ncbi:hypothetical protein M9H77_03258 [Catharanthus roseus]|uniref:Uncharacterized protein n=1 Tax=Catharanthus roseus TaxID=4058 RepID=A0ACC0CAX2_CATRO|nr:hypothetical protein M9H77_03258 [Catharanthus roseus]